MKATITLIEPKTTITDADVMQGGGQDGPMQFALTITPPENGEIICNYESGAIIDENTVIEYYANPNPNYAFSKIIVNTIETLKALGKFVMTDAKNLSAEFVASGLTLFLQVFDSIPKYTALSWMWRDYSTKGNSVLAGNQVVGTFNGSIYLTFTDLRGATISSWVGTATPSKISDQRINVTSGYLSSITLSDGSILIFNHRQRDVVIDIINSNDATITGANLLIFWGNKIDNIEPYENTLGATLYQIPFRTYGNQLITNGDFATDSIWNKTGTAQITGGEAVLNAFTDTISETIAATSISTIYEVKVTARGGGTVQIQMGGVVRNISIGFTGVNVEYAEYITALSVNATFSLQSRDNNIHYVDGISVKSIDSIPVGVQGSIMPICVETTQVITGFTNLGWFPAGSGALKGLTNKYYISGVDVIIPEGWYTIEELTAFESDNVIITQDANTVSLFKVLG